MVEAIRLAKALRQARAQARPEIWRKKMLSNRKIKLIKEGRRMMAFFYTWSSG